ncbi:exosortase/archaeosortase family protein [Scleromatobacter humisilvae]|uniref:Exosortase/archaeosortase family protein n=1 Tax=Scleromatobacter humisilvae TaxID=2897159 RepID=A0A9X2C1Y0_9BURK|nr:exosortase/archaeosortase family protein [Scleromatobacter humisilvae]MCK9686224.1 exosortase/archaeosortase family protein [Scleromatobacter humisilvae]
MTSVDAGVQRTTGEGDRRVAAYAAVGCGIAALVMAPTCEELARTWRDDSAFQWCWLVVPAVLHGLSQRVRANRAAPDLRGLWATVPAAMLWWLSDLMHIAVVQQLALVIAFHGIARSALGRHLYRECFATLALLFLMVPSADVLQPVLRNLTLRGIDLFAVVAGMPHRVDGYEVAIGAQHYIVIDECSGLASVTLSMFLGFFFGTLLYRSIWKVLSLAVLAALVGVASNLVRVVAIVWIDWARGSQMNLTAHAEIQWLSVLAVLVLMLFALARLRGDAASPLPAGALQSAVRRRDRFAPMLTGLSVPLTVWALTATGQALGAASADRDRPGPQAMLPLPATLAGAARTDAGLRWTIDAVHATATSAAIYRRDRLEIRASVVETLSPEAKLPRWQMPVGPSGRWHDMQTRRVIQCDSHGCVTYGRAILQGTQVEERRDMETAYCDAVLMTDSVLRIRAAQAWSRLQGLADPQRSVMLVVDGDGLSDGEAAGALRLLCGMRR